MKSNILRRPSRYLGLGLLVAGACFLFDPYVSIFDLLPDSLGYLFISLGLYYLSDLDDRLADAARGARRLALLNLARPVALLLTFGLLSPTERPVFILLVLFSLGVLDLLLLIPMWRSLGDGLLHLAQRQDGTAILDRRIRGGRYLHPVSITERFMSFTRLYFILREVLVVLPETTVLKSEAGGVDVSASRLYDAVGFFRLIGAALALILGIVWLCLTVRLIRRIKRDTPFLERLRDKYMAEIAPDHVLFATRAVKASMTALAAATVLSLDLYIEGVNVLPDILSAILLLLSVIFLRRYAGKSLPALGVTVAYGVMATVTWSLQLTTFNLNEVLDLRRYETEPPAAYSTVMNAQIITAILFVAAFVLILRSLSGMARRYTGLRALHEGSTYRADRTAEIHTRIRKKLITVGVFAGISALSTLVQWGLVPLLYELDFFYRPDTGETLVIMLYDLFREAYWLLDLALGGALIATTIHAGSEIFEQMDYSYMMN